MSSHCISVWVFTDDLQSDWCHIVVAILEGKIVKLQVTQTCAVNTWVIFARLIKRMLETFLRWLNLLRFEIIHSKLFNIPDHFILILLHSVLKSVKYESSVLNFFSECFVDICRFSRQNYVGVSQMWTVRKNFHESKKHARPRTGSSEI